jgi:hypothetical protein
MKAKMQMPVEAYAGKVRRRRRRQVFLTRELPRRVIDQISRTAMRADLQYLDQELESPFRP